MAVQAIRAAAAAVRAAELPSGTHSILLTVLYLRSAAGGLRAARRGRFTRRAPREPLWSLWITAVSSPPTRVSRPRAATLLFVVVQRSCPHPLFQSIICSFNPTA